MAKAKTEETKEEAVQAAETQAKTPVYTVKKQFRDKNDFNKLYQVGEDVTNLDAKRLETLINKGLVQK